ncbi:hypothetical protein [Bradyrhizobium amphicarpaeae]|nr:hypothetical protein [Bradyrhizobium amphicarpaeae]
MKAARDRRITSIPDLLFFGNTNFALTGIGQTQSVVIDRVIVRR